MENPNFVFTQFGVSMAALELDPKITEKRFFPIKIRLLLKLYQSAKVMSAMTVQDHENRDEFYAFFWSLCFAS